jgi:PIN domain nuclease of toxin-antitoxin system
MKVLLDTHIALWAIADSTKLPDKIIKIIESQDNEVYYSLASVWEIAIKHKLHPNKIQMSEDKFVELCEKTGFEQLPITVEQIYQLKTLDRPDNAPPHNDPFDRIMIAQAKQEKMKFFTHDSLVSWYGEPCVYKV